jgi:tetratricopeptide (TPR) repeat protein
MKSQIRFIGIAVFAISMLVAHTECRGATPGETKSTTFETVTSIKADIDGIGSNLFDNVYQASGLLRSGDIGSAEIIIDQILARFNVLMDDRGARYMCFRSDADYAKSVRNMDLVRVSIAFANALHTKAFIASSKKDWDMAIKYLSMQIEYAPHESAPYGEMGYILNMQKKHEKALASYKKGYDNSRIYGESKQEQAVMLRGAGFALIELGKLDEAADSYKRSLELDPGNPLAIKELRYIEKAKK